MVQESAWSRSILTATDVTGAQPSFSHNIIIITFLNIISFPLLHFTHSLFFHSTTECTKCPDKMCFFFFSSGLAVLLISVSSVWGGKSSMRRFRREETKISTPFKVRWNTQLILSSLVYIHIFKHKGWLFLLLLQTDYRLIFVSFPPSAGHSKGIEDMDMNAVRLCFQCELEWEDGNKDCLSPVVSNPIYDKSKTSPNALLWLLTTATATKIYVNVFPDSHT